MKLTQAFNRGLGATLAMSVVMLLSIASGLSPMPAPIPAALVKTVLGLQTPPLVMLVGALAHFLYGGIAAVAFVTLFKGRLGVGTGLLWGLVLWAIMQLTVLPLPGWGLFGTAVTPKIAAATLVLHLIYGGTLGWLAQRQLRADIPSTATE